MSNALTKSKYITRIKEVIIEIVIYFIQVVQKGRVSRSAGTKTMLSIRQFSFNTWEYKVEKDTFQR